MVSNGPPSGFGLSLTDETGWDAKGEWWLTELSGDVAYEAEITPLMLELARARGRVLDVGCGEGRLMAALRSESCEPFGIDIAGDLLEVAVRQGPVVRARLPHMTCFQDACFDGAVISLVLEHIPDHVTLLAELARVVKRGGFLALVVNHPIYTAPESGPIVDSDGEVLWRPGRYFDIGYTDEPAGAGAIRFHHRPLGELLSAAARAGWRLDEMVESGVTESQIERSPLLAEQRHIPRLLGVRWTKT